MIKVDSKYIQSLTKTGRLKVNGYEILPQSISDWMSSALTKGCTSLQSNPVPNQKRRAASSQSNPPPTQKRRTVKKPTSLKQEALSHQHKTTPLTAGSKLSLSKVCQRATNIVG